MNDIIPTSRNTEHEHQGVKSAWDTLNDRQRGFVLEYLKTFNGTQAYKSAYPLAKKDAARAAAARLLAKDSISAAIQEKLNSLWGEREALCGRTLTEILAVAFSDISQVINSENGKITLHNLEHVDSRAIKCIKHSITENGENFSITMHDKNAALSLLAKILQMLPDDKCELSGDIKIIPAVRPNREV